MWAYLEIKAERLFVIPNYPYGLISISIIVTEFQKNLQNVAKGTQPGY